MLSLGGGFVKGEWGRIKGITLFLYKMFKMFWKQIDNIVFYDKIKSTIDSGIMSGWRRYSMRGDGAFV